MLQWVSMTLPGGQRMPRKYTGRAIDMFQLKEFNTNQGRANLIECYIQMASLTINGPSGLELLRTGHDHDQKTFKEW